MQKFLVLYCMPAKGLEEWMKLPEAERKSQEESLKKEWDEWAAKNAGAIKETAGAGKTKRVTTGGTTDVKNDVMLYSVVEANSAEEAAKLFEGHPHLKIPEAWIDVMPANSLSGM
jgi:hypothetical protein